MSATAKDTLNDRYTKLGFLIGEYDVMAYNSLESSAWIESGRGTATYALAEAFITENVEIYKNDSTIVMHNTIGCDIEKDAFNMQTLDYNSGLMDIYEGSITNGILVFCNRNSKIKTTDEFGDSFCFKLIYKQLSITQNELVVGYSKDNGKTWIPYIKNIYHRK